jgi:competence protein ComFC
LRKVIQYFEDFWFLLFPHICEACGTTLHKNEGPVCFKCLYDLPRTDYCVDLENPVVELFIGRIKIEKATALFTFQKGSRFRKLLHALKYKSKPEIGILLGKELGAEMLKSKNFSDIDFIIPVPLHPNRQKQRGYNQSEMIGEGISKVTKIPMMIENLVRAKETVTQTKMTKEERWKNVSGKFVLNDLESLKNKHVLLIDDVITTGSTIEACGEVLLTVEGLRLSIAVLAKA